MSVETPSAPAVAAKMAAQRAEPILVRNSRIYCWLLLLISLGAALVGLGMVLMAITLIIPPRPLSFDRFMGIVQWGLGGISMVGMCFGLWTLERNIAFCSAKLDDRGIDFNLGTPKNPEELFIPWDGIASLGQYRVGSNRYFEIKAKDGSYANYSSTTFLRPKRLARLISERAGIPIKKI
jgi:hypothetical protein